MEITKYLKERKDSCKKVVNELLKIYNYVSILGVDNYGMHIQKDKYTINIADSSIERGFVIKVYDGKGYMEYACDDINDDNYLDVITRVKNIKISKDIKRVNAKMLVEDSITKSFTRDDDSPLEINEMITRLKKLVTTALNNELVINAYAIYDELNVNKVFISKEKDLEQSYPWRSVRVMVCTRKGNNIKNARCSSGGKDTLQLFEDVEKKLEDTCALGVALLDAQPITPGVYDVITDPTITGLIAHEAFGHGVEMDMFVKNRAKAVHYIDKYVASPILSMHDGASSCYSVASYFFDDDGVLAQDTEIIKNGILKRGISDALSAMQLNTVPTGNGRRQSFTHKAYTRMTNTYFVPGTDKLEDMIASVDYGFYLVDTNNGMEDPKNWQIQCVCEYAKEIKNGKFTGKIFSPVIMSGYVLDLLKSITMISDVFEIEGSGYCGKGHKEWVRVSDGGPHLKTRVKLG